MPGLPFTWTTNACNITSSGLFTADTTAGFSGFVNASTGGKMGTASVTIVPDQLTHIVISPVTVTVIAGATQSFTAVGYDQYNNSISGLTFTWTTNIGTMTGSSLTAQNVAGASGYVHAASGVVSGSAFVTIVPSALDHIILSPTGPLSVVAGSQTQFSAIGMDVHNNAISGLTFTWTTTVGGVTSGGLFTAQMTAGASGYVNASIGFVKGSTGVTIVHDQLTHIVVTAATIDVVAGTVQNFLAIGYDQYNNLIPSTAFTWTTNVGTMTDSSLSAQTTAGITGFVRATSGLVFGDASVTIVPTVLHHIDVSPSVLSAVAGSQTQFAAVGRDVYNNAISGLTFTWTSSVGSISGSGLLTANATAGVSGFVNASVGVKVRSASITIVPDQLTHIVVSPASVTVTAGMTQSFAAVGYDQFNNPLSGLTFVWTTNVGLMTGSTLTAQSAPGIPGYVRATVGLVSGDSVVTILPGALDHIFVSSSSMNIIAGSQVQFTALGKDAYNNTITGLTFNWTTDVGGIASSGLFTAQTTAGESGHVNTSTDGKTRTANVTIIPDQLTHIIVTPITANVTAGSTQAFTAVGYDQYNNAIPDLIITWTTDIGVMTGNSLTAQTGYWVTGHVRASNGYVLGDASVSIQPRILDLVVDAVLFALVVVAIHLFTGLWSKGSKKPPVKNVKGVKTTTSKRHRSRNEKQRH